MELDLAKNTSQMTGTCKSCSKTAKTSSPSFSASSWGLSGRLGVRVLMHRDMITCRFFRSLPRSWLKKYWRAHGHESKSSSSSPLRWSSSPFSRSSPHLSSVPSHFRRSPIYHLYFPALKDRERERDQAGPAASLDGHRGLLSASGMTISPWGPSIHSAATHNTSSTTAPYSSLGQSLRHNNSSG